MTDVQIVQPEVVFRRSLTRPFATLVEWLPEVAQNGVFASGSQMRYDLWGRKGRW